MTKKKITRTDEQRRAAYLAAESKQFGNLHERMKYVIACLESSTARDSELLHELNVAIYDLETEVSYHEPAKPPYGRREIRLDKS